MSMDTREHVGPAGIGSGAYTLFEAARIIRVPYQKLRRWASGYWYVDEDEERFSTAVVPDMDDDSDERILSFYELMELFVIGFFRRQGVSMQVIRATRVIAQRTFNTEYPYATQRLETDGSGIFAELPTAFELHVPEKRLTIELSKSQNTFDRIVRPFFRELDFDQGLAYRYWPMGRSEPVILDARRSFGRPIVESRGIPTYALFNMVESGEDRATVASWYRVTADELNSAIEYEKTLLRAA